MDYQEFKKIHCSVFKLNNITENLYNMRENYCKQQTEATFSNNCKGCKIRKLGYYIGLSCNETLNKFPNECMKIFEQEKQNNV